MVSLSENNWQNMFAMFTWFAWKCSNKCERSNIEPITKLTSHSNGLFDCSNSYEMWNYLRKYINHCHFALKFWSTEFKAAELLFLYNILGVKSVSIHMITCIHSFFLNSFILWVECVRHPATFSFLSLLRCNMFKAWTPNCYLVEVLLLLFMVL